MIIKSKIGETLDEMSFWAIRRYEGLPLTFKRTTERLADHGIAKKLYYYAVKILFDVFDRGNQSRLYDQFEYILSKASAQDLIGKPISENNWGKILEFKYEFNFTDREIRIALERKYIDRNLNVDVENELHRERTRTHIAWLLIAVIFTIALYGTYTIWSHVLFNVPIWLIALQFSIYSLISILFVAIFVILACFVFVRNIYPLSVALKIQKRKWKLDKSNITYLTQQ